MRKFLIQVFMSPIFAFLFDKRLKKTLKLSYEKDFVNYCNKHNLCVGFFRARRTVSESTECNQGSTQYKGRIIVG